MSEPGISIQQKKNRYSNWCSGANDKSDSCPVSCEAAYTFGAYPNGVLEDVTCSYINEDGISATQLSNRFNNFCVTGPVAANCPCACTAAINMLDHKGSKSPSSMTKTKKTKSPSVTKSPSSKGTKSPSSKGTKSHLPREQSLHRPRVQSPHLPRVQSLRHPRVLRRPRHQLLLVKLSQMAL